MHVLILDIETSPLVTYAWGIWGQNLGNHLHLEQPRMLCWAAKWFGEKKKVMFGSEQKGDMLGELWELLEAADVVVHFNGQKFDMPHINREFLLAGMNPPSPYKQVDLLLTARKKFRFLSNKLDFLVQQLGIGEKLSGTDFEIWKGCMAGKASAWKQMEKYNKMDVRLTEELYERLLPWISSHPNRHLYAGDPTACPTCGHEQLMKRGFAYTKLSKFQQYQCTGCGSYFRSNRRIEGATVQESVS